MRSDMACGSTIGAHRTVNDYIIIADLKLIDMWHILTRWYACRPNPRQQPGLPHNRCWRAAAGHALHQGDVW